jgi:hypothetical protein
MFYQTIKIKDVQKGDLVAGQTLVFGIRKNK